MGAKKSLLMKKRLAKKQRQNRPLPNWFRYKTDNTIRYNAKRRHWRRTKLKVYWLMYLLFKLPILQYSQFNFVFFIKNLKWSLSANWSWDYLNQYSLKKRWNKFFIEFILFPESMIGTFLLRIEVVFLWFQSVLMISFSSKEDNGGTLFFHEIFKNWYPPERFWSLNMN